MRVAWIGLGVMGYPMAGHLALAGHRVQVGGSFHGPHRRHSGRGGYGR